MNKTFIFLIILFLNFSALADDKDWLIEKANEGDPIAQNNTGYNYLYGLNGFPEDLENAIKYSYKRSDIIVRVEQLQLDEVSVSIINKGEGIPEKYIDRLTERFFRVDKARSRELGGTGLGLAIVKHILIKHRARLEINSVLKESTTFSIKFPLTNT